MDPMLKSTQLNNNNINNQANTKAENKRASERIQAELRPKPDASKWYRDQANRERSEEAKRAAEEARQKVNEIFSTERK